MIYFCLSSFKRGGVGSYPNPLLLRNFFVVVCVWTFFTWFPKTWGKGGELPHSKEDKELFLLWLGHFSMNVWENDQNSNTLRNFSPYKFVFFFKFVKGVKKQRGGGARSSGSLWKKTKRNWFFSQMVSLSHEVIPFGHIFQNNLTPKRFEMETSYMNIWFKNIPNLNFIPLLVQKLRQCKVVYLKWVDFA